MRNVCLPKMVGAVAVLALLASCGARDPLTEEEKIERQLRDEGKSGSSLRDLFAPRKDFGQLGAVNKYIWTASLDVLNFLPITNVDPFTGVITTGFGTPPGGGTAYRATIFISDPALEARSLKLALMTRRGPASAATTRALEDAILTRARQLRAKDSRL